MKKILGGNEEKSLAFSYFFVDWLEGKHNFNKVLENRPILYDNKNKVNGREVRV